MRTDPSAWSWLLAFGALCLFAGCPGTLADKALYEAALDGARGLDGAGGSAGVEAGPCGDVVARIFVPTCGGTSCHGTNAPQQDLDLVSPGLASREVGAGHECRDREPSTRRLKIASANATPDATRS